MKIQFREHGATVVVSAIASLFASALILFTGILSAALDPELLETSGTFRMMLLIVSSVFIVIALYVGAIVTANTFATIIAGRTRTIALLRLIGATSTRVRAQIATEGLLVGVFGAILGGVVAVLLSAGVVSLGPVLGWLPEGRDYPLFDPLVLVAVAVVVLTTWIAAWTGSRPVGKVSPIAATGAAVEPRPETSRARSPRSVWAVILLVLGTVLLVFGVLLGLFSPLALLVAFLGGVFSFTGIAIGAHLVMPPILRLTGRLLGNSPTARLAVANAERFPVRSSRSTIGLVIGVTLVTMFTVAQGSYQTMSLMAFDADPEIEAMMAETLGITTAVFTGLVGFSAVIAAVGMINTLSLGVMQRARELGLLRALGFTGGQVRGMVIAESVQMTTAALGFGLLLGIFYGWAAAQSMLGSQVGIVAPTVPWLMLAGVVIFGGVLAVGAAAAPSRRATKVSPVAALAVA